MKQINLEKIIALRKALHERPEVSGQEVQTKQLLLDFLRKHTSLELVECGNGFYGAHREEKPQKPAIALRADYDALALPQGGAAHLCGHDGHAAALCGTALMLEGASVGRDVFLLFQPAEETGEGAKPCTAIFEQEKVGEIYGAHNLPGYPLGQVTTRAGTFACGSCGLTLYFKGKATHAAYPEHGVSPAMAIGKLLCVLPKLTELPAYKGMVLCTVIGVQMGEKAFGAAAAEGEVWLTLRGEYNKDLNLLYDKVLRAAEALAEEYALEFSMAEQDRFPSTENTPSCAEKVLEICGGQLLETPMRWSEDFGHYLQVCSGAFFGIGAGEKYPPLHTEHYEYPDVLLEPTMEAFWKLVLF